METFAASESQERVGAAGGDPVLVRVAEVAGRPLAWLWPRRVPRGKLTLVAGDPGLGKSLLALDIAARVTCGLPWPDSEELAIGDCRLPIDVERRAQGAAESAGAIESWGGEMPAPQSEIGNREPAIPERSSPGNVILLSAEDDVADTIRPRLEAAGADLERVAVLDSVRRANAGGTAESPFSLAADLDTLERAIERTGDVGLVILDPVTAYLARAGRHRSPDLRDFLAALGKVAQRRGVAVLAVTHLNKRAGTSALYRATGRVAFVAAARAVWAVVGDAACPGRHLFLPVKCNLAHRLAGLAFSIQDAPGRPGTPVIAWEREPVLQSADDALATINREVATERERAAAWLRELLAAGPLSVTRIKVQAESAGFAWPTLRRAKARLPVEIYHAGFGTAWHWRLAGHCGSPGPIVDQPLEVINNGQPDQQ